MVSITKQKDHFVFEVKGMHKLWAFKSELVIPVDHVLNAIIFSDHETGRRGWRAPGTYVPYMITAGTFHLDGTKIFWDVVNEDKSIVVVLKDEEFKELIIEVEDPVEAINLLKGV